MKIGLSATLLHGADSGVGQYVLALLRALMRHAPEHRWVVFALERDLPLLEFARTTAQVVPVSERYRPPLKDFTWHQTRLPRLARDLALDVLHVPSHRRMLWPRPCGLVATIADAGAFRPARQSGLPTPTRSTVFRILARRQDALVAVSGATAAAVIQATRVPSARVQVVPPGVDHARFTPGGREEAATRIARRYGIKPPFFLYVARIELARNHARLIAAFNAFKTSTPSPWQLVLLGADGRGAERVHQAVRRSPYAQDIYCPGFIGADDLPDWYRAAGALVYPTARGGFCLPVLEAMACGCPVLASSTGQAPELAGSAARLAAPRDIAALRRELTQLAFDPARRDQLRCAGLERARAFDWEHTARALLEIYARAAHRQPATVRAAPPIATVAH